MEKSFTVGGEKISLALPAGPYVRIQGTEVQLEVLGQRLSGDFAFEQVTSLGADGVPGTNDDVKAIRIAAANVNLSLGDGTADLVMVTGAAGALFLTPEGLAGEVKGAVGLNVPGISSLGRFGRSRVSIGGSPPSDEVSRRTAPPAPVSQYQLCGFRASFINHATHPNDITSISSRQCSRRAR